MILSQSSRSSPDGAVKFSVWPGSTAEPLGLYRPVRTRRDRPDRYHPQYSLWCEGPPYEAASYLVAVNARAMVSRGFRPLHERINVGSSELTITSRGTCSGFPAGAGACPGRGLIGVTRC